MESNRIIFLTGAGISKESGVPTYRGEGGIYNEKPELYQRLLQNEYENNPDEYWDYTLEKRRLISNAKPNQAHFLIKKIENYLKDNFFLITQNIDSFHKEVGNHNLLELHGNLWDIRCNKQDKLENYLDYLQNKKYELLGYNRFEYLLEMCNCESSTVFTQTLSDSNLRAGFRPHITFFNDSISNKLPVVYEFSKTKVNEIYLIGTSLEVSSVFNILKIVQDLCPEVNIYNVNPGKSSCFIHIKETAIEFLEKFITRYT